MAEDLTEDFFPTGESSISDPFGAYLAAMLKGFSENRQTLVEAKWLAAEANVKNQYDGPARSNSGEDSWRSKAFYPVTTQKVMSAVSHLSDALFRGKSFPYKIDNSTLVDSPSNQKMVEDADKTPPEQDVQPGQGQPDAQGQEVSQPVQDGQVPVRQTPTGEAEPTVRDIMIAQGFDIDENLRRHREKIDDQLEEGKAIREGRKGLWNGAVYGTSVFESPILTERKRNEWVFKEELGYFEKREWSEFIPIFKARNVWNYFPDPENGGDPQAGQGVFHRNWLSIADLRGMLKMKDPETGEDIYDKDVIEEIITAKNSKLIDGVTQTDDTQDPVRDEVENPLKKFDVYTFAGKVPAKLAKTKIDGIEEEDTDYIEVIIEIHQGKIVRARRNPFPAQKRPFHSVKWESFDESPWGRGIPEKIFSGQKDLNVLTRKFIDNKNLSGDVMFKVVWEALADGTTREVYPGKFFEFQENYKGRLSDVFETITVADTTSGTLDGIGVLLERINEDSGVPGILDGAPGVKGATAFADNERIKASLKQLGLVLNGFDEDAWVPIVEGIYDWNMTQVDTSIQGDFAITATGFSSFQEKTSKNAKIIDALLLGAKDPRIRDYQKLKEHLVDYYESADLDPEKYILSDDELKGVIEANIAQEEKLKKTQSDLIADKAATETQAKIAVEESKGAIDIKKQEVENAGKIQVKELENQSKKEIALLQLEAKDKDSRRSTGE